VLAEAKLINIAEDKFTMFKNMIRINLVKRVVGRMDVRIAILESSFEYERGRKPVTSRRTCER
jgi:hypothetical protein